MNFVSRWGNRPYNCYSAVFHPTDSEVLYAAIEAGGSVNGIWRSGDSGQTWEQLTAGMPSGELLGRISLAISPSHPDILYALASSRGRRVIGVFRTDDGGQSWVDTAGTTFVKEGQLAYNSAIAVHPEDPDIVICGAQNLFRTVNGGTKWEQISQNDPTDTSTAYVHADQHAILMSGGNLSAGMLVYSANDGGIAISRDLGTTWDSSSRGMATIQFYEADVSPGNGDVFGGGTQDNGTLLAGVTNGVGLQTGRKNRRDFVRVVAGDGGYVVFDPGNVERVYASSLGADMSMHTPGRRWAKGESPTAWNNITPPEISKAEKSQRALTVLAIEPGANRRGRKLFLGTYRLWMWTLIDLRWQPASQFGFDGSSISAIEISPVDTNLMFVGTSNGGVFRSRDGGANWSADLSGPEIPSVVITDIRTHPTDSNVVAVAVASTGAQAAVLEGHDRPFSHVFLSSDYGKIWDDIDGGKLPNVVFTSLEYETHEPYRLLAAGDAGPWIFEPESGWISLAGAIPNVVISDIFYHDKDRTLTAATYGRGMWRTRLPRKLKIEPPDKNVLPKRDLPPKLRR